MALPNDPIMLLSMINLTLVEVFPPVDGLCQDLYDNRTMYPDTRYAANANRVVSSILDMHARNLL